MVRPWILSKVSGFFSALKDGYAFRIKFKDRTSAASIIASTLKGRMSSVAHNKQKDVIVIGIPRGGAIAADVVAKKLSADFDSSDIKKVTRTTQRSLYRSNDE